MAGRSRNLTLLLCLCFLGRGFGMPDAAAQSDSSFKIGVEVELGTGQVAVPDKNGNPVRTLTKEALVPALATPVVAARLPVVFRAVCFYDSPRTARVLLATRIRMEKTKFRKQEGQLQTNLDIMGVAYAEDGGVAARFSQTLPVSFDEKRESEFRKEGLRYRNYFRLRPGKYLLKLAVSDGSGNVGAMEQFLEVPVFPDRQLAVSSIVLIEQASHLPDLVRNLQSQLLDEVDPLLYRGFEIEPSVDNRLRTGSVVPLIFRVYNLSGPPDRWNLTAKARLVDEEEKEYALGPISLKDAVSSLGNGEAVVALSLSFSDALPGKYRLIIETTESSVAETAIARMDLEFMGQRQIEEAEEREDSSQGQASSDAGNKTVIEMTEKELRRSYSNQLEHLKFDENQKPLEALMERVGANVLAFFRDLSNVASKEKIMMTRSQRINGRYGMVRYYSHPAFDSRVEEYQYLILPDSGKPGIPWVEYRSDDKNQAVDLLEGIAGFMVSSGYAGYCRYFDPKHRKKSNLRYLGRETGKQRNHVIAFAQKPESGDYLSYYYDSGSSTRIQFLVQGFVWVTPDTCQISRIYTSMLSMENPSSLRAATADVVYRKITFGDDQQEFWLPREVQVEWEFPDKAYKTRHRYSDYRLFTVKSDYKISKSPPAE
jgi:hypothetical protein